MGLLPVVLLLSMQAHATPGPVTVFAAASLKEAFTSLARSYESARPGSKVNLNFGGSQLLAAQINHGAPADVFASAALKNLSDTNYDKASLRVFAHNRLVIVVRSGFRGLATPADLGRAERIVVAAAAVPVGHYTQTFLDKGARRYGKLWAAGVNARIVSRELDVKSVLAKVKLGEADAGVVYVSDAATARGQVQSVAIPDDLNTVAEYPVAVPSDAPNKDRAKDFITFLFTPVSQRTFEVDGFVSPLRPVKEIPIVDWTARGKVIPFPPKKSLPLVALKVGSESLRGIPVSAVFGKSAARTATFTGADSCSQSLSIADLKAHKAILVLRPDQNYQVVVPGMNPSFWVNWIRKIDLR
jgi:molybdate transport system substrate-binding protein